jgi:predicted nucleic acid-binding protein
VFREPDALRVAPHLLRASRLIVPQLFSLELANIGRTKALRGEVEWEVASELLKDVSAWPVETVTVSWAGAWELSRRRGLTVYDATYLYLSVQGSHPLLSLDGELQAAAGRR